MGLTDRQLSRSVVAENPGVVMPSAPLSWRTGPSPAAAAMAVVAGTSERAGPTVPHGGTGRVSPLPQGHGGEGGDRRPTHGGGEDPEGGWAPVTWWGDDHEERHDRQGFTGVTVSRRVVLQWVSAGRVVLEPRRHLARSVPGPGDITPGETAHHQ